MSTKDVMLLYRNNNYLKTSQEALTGFVKFDNLFEINQYVTTYLAAAYLLATSTQLITLKKASI